jgi:hypothetical protein
MAAIKSSVSGLTPEWRTGRAHERNRERLTGPRRMTSDEIELQFDRLRRIDRNIRQPPEARRDAVDRRAACELRLDELTSADDASPRRGRDLDRRPRGDRLERLQREAVAVELDRHRVDQFGRGWFANGGPF